LFLTYSVTLIGLQDESMFPDTVNGT